MKSLSNDQKEEIIINVYENKWVGEYAYPEGVNIVLEVLGYKDRLRFSYEKEILVWSTIHDH